jgi:thiamine biosynthesis protein ThiI
MNVPGADVVVVRHGDIGVKSAPVQSWMEETLAENLKALLTARSIAGHVEQHWGRLFVRTDEAEAAARAAADVFGVASASPARTVEPTLDAISDGLAEIAAAAYDGGSFAVEASRAGDHEFTSQDVGQVGGEAIWAAVEAEFEPEVDLDDPDCRFEVEVREGEAYLFLERFDGPGGLPVGTQSPMVALISGGIDSPVAAWLAMKRGAPIVPVYFDLGVFGGTDHRARAIEAVRKIAGYAPGEDHTLRIAPLGPGLEAMAGQVGDTRMLSVRRLMYLIAAEIAADVGAEGIVTGEAIGQKASQTATNLRVTDGVTDWPIHRPLLSMNKQEIIALARDIGTYETSSIDAGCNKIAPEQPETGADLERVADREPDLEKLAREAAAGVELLSVDPIYPASGE